jgi:uncharacterized protein YdiU (UPF0061 family)
LHSYTQLERREDPITPSSRQNRPDAGWKFENSYARLPQAFYARLNLVPVRQPKLVVFNEALARVLGLGPDAMRGGEGDAAFFGQQDNRYPFRFPSCSSARP